MPDDVLSTRLRGGSPVTWWIVTLGIQAILVGATFVRFVDGYPVVEGVDALAMASLGLLLISVLFRTRAPWVFLAAATFVNFVYTLDLPRGFPGFGLLVSLPFGMYAVASSVPLARAVIAAVVADSVLLLTAILDRGIALWNIYPVTVTAAIATSTAIGQVTYIRRRLLETTERRAFQAEQTREAMEAAIIAEQRLATARNLHDVVGHQIAVINLQAGAAMKALDHSPQDAAKSLQVIQQSSDAILVEIGELLRVLRSGTDTGGRDAQGLGALPALVGTLEAGGFFVDLRIDDAAREISPEIERAMYRIMEEALVNAYKHGSPASRAQASLARTGDELELRVSNEIDPRGSGPSTGFGIVDIEEQARSLGGAAEVATNGGVYELTVRLPAGAQ